MYYGPTVFNMTSSEIELISDSTPAIDLVQYFDVDREVLFVLTGNRISGLIHLSDLNSSLCEIAFFTFVNNIERTCLEILAIRILLLTQACRHSAVKPELPVGKGLARLSADRSAVDAIDTAIIG